MQLACPHCGFSRELPPERVPSRPVRATCPSCRQSFSFDPAAPAPGPPEGEEAVEPGAGVEQARPAGAGAESTPGRRPSATEAGEPPGVKAPPLAPEKATVTCPACGLTQLPAPLCAGCGAAFVVRPVAAAGYAGFWIRVVAALVDGLLVGLLQFTLTFLLGLVAAGSGAWNAGGGEGALALVTWLFGVMLSAGYYIVFTGHGGQTPGKMAVRVKVVRTDGSPVGYLRAALREVPGKFLSGLILGIGYLMVAFDERKQGLHDKIAGTVVIKL